MDEKNISSVKSIQVQLTEEEDRFKSLFQVTTTASTDFKTQLQEVLRISARYLKIELGLVSQIDVSKGTYYIYSAYPTDARMQAGQILPLQHTYCRVMLEEGMIIAVCPIRETPLSKISAYQLWPLDTYIGTSLYVNESFFGTICFASESNRQEPFTEMDKLYVEMVGKWISKMLEIEFQQEALIQQNNQLSQLNQQLDQFIYSVSHDLKQPVININNMINLLSENIPKAEKEIVERAMGYLKTSANKLQHTVENLLEVSRISNTELLFETINLSQASAEIIQYFEKSLSEESWDIQVDFEACPQIHFPPVYFNSIMDNILSNAIKYRSPKRKLTVFFPITH